MESIEAKIKKIMQVLFNNPHYLTLEFIAQSIGLSKRSIQNYLTHTDNWIIKNGLLHTKIIRKPGQGVIIYTNAMDRLKIDKLLSGKSLSIYHDDNKRRLDIIKKLIILQEDMSIRSLAEHFYVGRSTVISDLEWVKEWLSSYKINLCIDRHDGVSSKEAPAQRKGVVIHGGEISYRNAIAGYFDAYRAVESGETIEIKSRDALHDKRLQNLAEIYPEDMVEKVKQIIESSEKMFNFFLTDDFYISLLTHIVISISRYINGNTVPEAFTPPDDEAFPAFVIKTAEYIAACLEAVFNIKVSDMERMYICIHLVGFNALSAEHAANAETPEDIKYLALELIKGVDTQLGTRFISDELLFFGLCLHLKTTVYRLRNDVYYKKTSKCQLSGGYMDIYNAVAKTGNLYGEICGVRPDEEELLDISCYLLLSLRRNRRRLKAVLVCNEGISERMGLLDMLTDALPSVDITDCCTKYQLKLLTYDECDFLISTEAMEEATKPSADLSMLDRSEYVDFILGFINSLTNTRTGHNPYARHG